MKRGSVVMYKTGCFFMHLAGALILINLYLLPFYQFMHSQGIEPLTLALTAYLIVIFDI